MPKHLKAAIKECRYLLEKDFAGQCHEKNIPGPGNHTITSENSVEETSLAFLIRVAVLRCFEEQRWKIPSQLSSFSDDYEEISKRLTSSHNMLRSEIGFLLHYHVSPNFMPSSSSLKTIFFHFTETISPDEWRSEHILGWIYQYFHENTLSQKQHGRFYTPEPIANHIVSQTLDMALNGRKTNDEGQITLLDLACGCGVFALRAFDRLYELYKDGLHLSGGVHLNNLKDEHFQSGAHPYILKHILEHHLFLVDNDPWACQIAAVNLYLKAKRMEPDCVINKMNIFCGDALQRWEEFYQIRELFTRQYDCVVGNPPYIVVNQLRTPRDVIQLYKSYRSAAFKINIFALFIERGIELLKPNGFLGMIVPNTLLTQVYFEPLRKYILQTSKILHILDTKRLFDNAFVENCILLLQREAAASERALNVVDCVANTSNGKRKNPQLTPPISEPLQPTTQIPQHHFEKAPFNMFNVRIDERVFVLMEKIASGKPKLADMCESHDGVNPGNAKHKLIASEKPDKTCKKVLNGKNIGRYWLKWDGLYVRYNRNLLSKGDNVRWGHQLSLDSAKILTRQTADRIIGTYDHGEYYTTNSIHTTILKDGVQEFHLKYLLALLNSKLISFYYQKLFPEIGQVFSQVKLINLRQLPLKLLPLEDQTSFVAQVDDLLRERKLLQKLADNNTYDILKQRRIRARSPKKLFLEYLADVEMVWCHLREIDEGLDQKVYELYQLSPEEIQMVEEELGKGVCLCPKVPVDELKKEISFDAFQRQYCERARTIFHMADHYAVHPESLLELRKAYKIFRAKDLKKIVSLGTKK